MADETETGWIVAGASTVIATLASAVAFLFRNNEAKNTASIAKLENQVELLECKVVESDRKHDECQQDRVRLSVEVAIIREHLANYIKSNGDHGK